MEDRCIFCGAVIPEGKLACPTCTDAILNNVTKTDEDAHTKIPETKGEWDMSNLYKDIRDGWGNAVFRIEILLWFLLIDIDDDPKKVYDAFKDGGWFNKTNNPLSALGL